MMKRVVLAFIAALLLTGCYARVGPPPRHRRVVAPPRVVVPLPPRVIVVP